MPDPRRVHEMTTAMGCPWPEPRFVASTGSTNSDALEMASAGAVEGTCIVAGEQTTGRGRHGRRWVSDQGAGLWSSTIIRSCEQRSRLPLVAALAVVDVARELGGMAWGIKWPNDVLDSGGRKVAGILVEVMPPQDAAAGSETAVVGIGLNVNRPPLEFAHAGSWVGDSRVSPDRSALLAGLLSSLFVRVHQPWEDTLADYRDLCRTIGLDVHVVLPGGEEFDGVAADITSDGHLVVDIGSTSRIVVAGDVLHATIAP